jgi:hypothetical protein
MPLLNNEKRTQKTRDDVRRYCRIQGGGFENLSGVFEITNKVRKCLICDDGVPHIFKNGTDALLQIYNGGYGT